MILVVGAAIVRDGRVLAALRSRPPVGWEFPGGKVEQGEDETAALERECREELGVEVAVGTLLAETRVDQDRVLRVYLALLRSGEPAAREDHSELRWLGATELGSVTWLAADRPGAEALGPHLR